MATAIVIDVILFVACIILLSIVSLAEAREEKEFRNTFKNAA